MMNKTTYRPENFSVLSLAIKGRVEQEPQTPPQVGSVAPVQDVDGPEEKADEIPTKTKP